MLVFICVHDMFESKEGKCDVIRLLVVEDVGVREVHVQKKVVCGEHALSFTRLQDWHKPFREVREPEWWFTTVSRSSRHHVVILSTFISSSQLLKALKGHIFTRTAWSWKIFETGPDLSWGTSISRIFTTWCNSGTGACKVLGVTFEIYHVISFWGSCSVFVWTTLIKCFLP